MKEIIEFLKDYTSWIDRGALSDDIYLRGVGLCSNMRDYLDEVKSTKDVYYAAQVELRAMFVEDGLCQSYPFNGGGWSDYDNEVSRNTCYQNAARINWVRSTIAKAEQKCVES